MRRRAQKQTLLRIDGFDLPNDVAVGGVEREQPAVASTAEDAAAQVRGPAIDPVFDVADQRRALREVQLTLATDVPIVVVYRLDDVVALVSQVTGFHPTLGTYMDDMLDVDRR